MRRISITLIQLTLKSFFMIFAIALMGSCSSPAKKELGLNCLEKLNQESWGGRFTQPDLKNNHWCDHPDGSITVSKWRRVV